MPHQAICRGLGGPWSRHVPNTEVCFGATRRAIRGRSVRAFCAPDGCAISDQRWEVDSGRRAECGLVSATSRHLEVGVVAVVPPPAMSGGREYPHERRLPAGT